MKNLIDLSRQLSRVKRFQVYNLFNEYNVAEHSYRVAMLCHIIANDPVTRNEAIQKALFHDLEEVILGDFPGPLKKRNKEFNKQYDILAEEVMADTLNVQRYYNLWKSSKAGRSGMVVHLADNLEAFQTVLEEVEAGNKGMLPTLKRFIEGIPHIYTLELLKEFPEASTILTDLRIRYSKLM